MARKSGHRFSGHGHAQGVMARIAQSAWTPAWSRIASSKRVAVSLLVALHTAGIATLYATEYGWFGVALALLIWILFNALWLVVVRRPAVAAALSLASVAALIVLSQFKYSILQLTLTFLDFLIVDQDTVAFLLAIFPQLRWKLLIAALVCVPIGVMLWRFDVLRVRRMAALAVALIALGGIVAGAKLRPEQPWEPFGGVNHVSNFARSGVAQVASLMAHSWIEHDSTGHGPFNAMASSPLSGGPTADECRLTQKPPHIVMVLDEFELRHLRSARHQGAARLSRLLQVGRRRAADLRG